MECASSAIKKLESDFDAVFGPDESESERPLWPATSDQRHVSNECTNQVRKSRKLGPNGRAFRFWRTDYFEQLF